MIFLFAFGMASGVVARHTIDVDNVTVFIQQLTFSHLRIIFRVQMNTVLFDVLFRN